MRGVQVSVEGPIKTQKVSGARALPNCDFGQLRYGIRDASLRHQIFVHAPTVSNLPQSRENQSKPQIRDVFQRTILFCSCVFIALG